MAAQLTERLDEQKGKLDALVQNVTHRTEEFSGRVREEGLETVLRAAAQTLGSIARFGKQIPPASKLADALAARASALDETVAELQRPPIANYDELNVKQVQDEIEGLDRFQMLKTRAYEEANKNRKTVLSAIDQALEQ